MTLLTEWGEALDPDTVLPEYPRPQLVRDSYLNLNGRWNYAIVPAEHDRPREWDGEIVVPFSPECVLSGVERMLHPTERLWYCRLFELEASFVKDRVLLHFGAVDQECTVWVNGVLVGSHSGGYLPFALDITAALAGHDGAHELVVAVRDVTDESSHSRGKQKLKRGGIWYTPQSGIWQTVWLESVAERHVERLEIVPRLEQSAVDVTVVGAAGSSCVIDVLVDGAVLASASGPTNSPMRIALPDVRAWSPEHPFLYGLRVVLGDDTVTSYFGMRSFGVGPDSAGVQRLLLNGEPYFHAGVLDQGYWSDGMYTAPSDAALIYDIELAKQLGFTMVRKHIKIEPMRWYYHCDRLGILVWQDMVNGGGHYNPVVITAPVLTPLRLSDHRYRAFGREDAAGRDQYRVELDATVDLLRNVVSLAVWVPFNEGWGQFDANSAVVRIRELDDTRSIDHASGWHDQGGGDLTSLHIYFRKFRMRAKWRRSPRALVISEYGGYSHRVRGHSFSDVEFGYKRFASVEDFGTAFRRLHEREIQPAISAGLSATVYTQLTDVEDELNGFVSYDRRVLKLPALSVRAITNSLRLEDQ